MSRITRRWCLLAIAGAPIVLGISAQTLVLRLDNDYLRVRAPDLQFLVDKPLQRLMDGNTVDFLGQLTVATGSERTVQGRSIVHFALSYDIWSEPGFKVTVLTPGQNTHPYSRSNLTRAQAQAWCLDQLRIDLTHVPSDRPIWVRLEIRSENPSETAGIIGEPGISLSGLIELFSHPVKNQQVRIVEERGPINISDLRKPHS